MRRHGSTSVGIGLIVIGLLTAILLPATQLKAEAGAVDVTDKISAMVRDGVLTLTPTNDLVASDPAPGKPKKLRVEYTIDSHADAITVFEKTPMRLVAPRSSGLIITKAYYGDFPSPRIDVTQTIRDAMRDGKIERKIDKQFLGGDPAPGKAKLLRISYRVGSIFHQDDFADGDTLRLPAADDINGNLEVINAIYGDMTAPEPSAPKLLPAEPKQPAIIPNAFPSPAPTEYFPWPVPAVYQWSVPVEGGNDIKRAYLWIPERAQHIRGLVVGLQNMLEKPMFQDPTIRRTCAEAGLGIVWISPGHNGGDDESINLLFKNPDKQWQNLVDTLAALAEESGYQEVATVPLLTVGHSAAMPFNYGAAELHPERVFAQLAYKGWHPGGIARNMPILHVSSEVGEWGKDWGNTWLRLDRPALLKYRSYDPAPLLGEFADIGTGHFNYEPQSGHILAMFIKKVADARLPAASQTNETITIKPIRPEDGVLVEAQSLGTPGFKAIPYEQYTGDKSKAYWYLDQQLATAINNTMVSRLAKKPQMITYMLDGKPDLMSEQGFANQGVTYLDDGFTFEVEAAFIDRSPTPNLHEGIELGHADSPIRFRVGSGGIRQVGPNQFQPYIDRGGVQRQGPPWENWVLAYHPGDDNFRMTDRPRHVWVPSRNTAGQTQTISFDTIDDVAVGADPIPLRAAASSGKAVQFFVISGPVLLENDILVLQPIPPGSRFPVKVMVAAYQWGSAVDPKWQSAGPVVQAFLINRP